MSGNQRNAITMTPAEVAQFLQERRVATVATVGPGGRPHLVAMWYGVQGTTLSLETKLKSQKAVNLRRDPRITVSVEAGDTYDQLRGVSIDGHATLLDDPTDEAYWAVAVDIWQRYQGPYTEQARPLVEYMMHKRVVVLIEPERIRSWDHRKLGLDPMPVAGSTAAAAASYRGEN